MSPDQCADKRGKIVTPTNAFARLNPQGGIHSKKMRVEAPMTCRAQREPVRGPIVVGISPGHDMSAFNQYSLTVRSKADSAQRAPMLVRSSNGPSEPFAADRYGTPLENQLSLLRPPKFSPPCLTDEKVRDVNLCSEERQSLSKVRCYGRLEVRLKK